MMKEQVMENFGTEAKIASIDTAATDFIYDTEAYQEMSSKRSFDLVNGVKIHVDMSTGETVTVFSDITRNSTLLSVALSHVFNGSGILEKCGCSMRFNVQEQLIAQNISADNDPQVYLYSDVLGNEYYLRDDYYYENNGSRVYLTPMQKLQELEYSEENGYTWNGQKVYYEGYTAHEQKFLDQREIAGISTFKNTIMEKLDEVITEKNLECATGAIGGFSYLKGVKYTKHFNTQGHLMLMYDNYGNFVFLHYKKINEYDLYPTLTYMVDNYGNVIRFTYRSDGMLDYIDDMRDRRIRYAYGAEDDLYGSEYHLTKISYHKIVDGVEENAYAYTKIGYLTNGATAPIALIETMDGKICRFSYTGNKLEQIRYFSGETELLHYNFTFNTTNAIVTDQDGNRTIYVLNGEKIDSSYQEKYGKVCSAVKYAKIEESDGGYTKVTSKAKASSLCKNAYENYIFVAGEIKSITYDSDDAICAESITGIEVTPTVTKEITTTYQYDSEKRVTQKRAVETYSNDATYVYVTEYVYDDEQRTDTNGNTYNIYGNVKKQISYVEGEETTSGYAFIFYTYDESGKLLKTKSAIKKCTCTDTCTCKDLENSDSLAGFVSEQVYDDIGRLIVQKDALGKNETAYEYVPNTNLLAKRVTPESVETVYMYDAQDRMTRLICGSNYNTIGYTDGDVAQMGNSLNAKFLQFGYDAKRRLNQIQFGDRLYETIDYGEKEIYETYTVDRVTITNAKNEKFKVLSDVNGCVNFYFYTPAATTEMPNPTETLFLQVFYDEYGRVIRETGVSSDKTYTYDDTGRLTEYTDGTITETFAYYPETGELAMHTQSGVHEHAERYIRSSNSQHRLTEYQTLPFRNTYNYDIYGRLTKKTVYCNSNIVADIQYYYDYNENRLTHCVRAMNDVRGGGGFVYDYDSRGNIVQVRKGSVVQARYEYDELNRLTVEINPIFGKKNVYAYNNRGDIVSKEEYLLSSDGSGVYEHAHTYGYSYNGQYMTDYDGQKCVYDAVGNPTTYRGKSLTWEQGKRLTAFDGNTLNYDEQGRRTNSRGVRCYYDSQGRVTALGGIVKFYYDESGPIGFKYGNRYLYYRKDLQGNIVAILDSSRAVVVQYVYDAWGNHKILDANGNDVSNVDSIGWWNPFRYRGYFYDTETGLYYLKSRYYDPQTGRFINMDSVEYADPSILNGLNLYAYCNNNPVMHIDPNGNVWWKILAVVVAVVAVVAVVVNHIVSIAECNKAEKEVEDEYTIDEAKTAIEEVLGDDYQGEVILDKNLLRIENSNQVTSRYDRILISTIYQNTVDSEGNKLTDRTTYGLAAEWAFHNFSFYLGIEKERARNVDLNKTFKGNDPLVQFGSIVWMVIGGL